MLRTGGQRSGITYRRYKIADERFTAEIPTKAPIPERELRAYRITITDMHTLDYESLFERAVASLRSQAPLESYKETAQLNNEETHCKDEKKRHSIEDDCTDLE